MKPKTPLKFQMYFFFILIFLSCSFSEASSLTFSSSSSSSSLKRKQDNETIQDRNPKIAKINEEIRIIYRSKIESISSDCIFYIGSFLENPYGTLPLVCKIFNDSLNKNGASPQFLLNSRSIYPNLIHTPKFSSDLNRLLSVEKTFLNERFRDLLYPGSLFEPANPETVEYAALFILRKFQDQSALKNSAFEQMVLHLTKTKNYLSLLRLIKIQPTISLYFVISTELTEIVWTAFKIGLDHLSDLKNSMDINNRLHLLITIVTTPISLIEFQNLSENIYPEFVTDIIAASCSLLTDDVFVLSDQENQFIYERNLQILESLPQFSDVLVQWAKLCNDLKHSKIPDVLISEYFFRDLSQYILLKYNSNKQIAKSSLKSYHDFLIICAVIGNYKNIFEQILKMNQINRSSKKIRTTLLKFPKYMKLLSLTDFTRTFGKKDQVLLLRNNNISLDKIFTIRNVYEKLRVVSEFFPIEDFGYYLRLIHEDSKFSFPTLISKIITSESERIVPVINAILEYCLTINLSNSEIKKIGYSLGNPKYIVELLQPENLQFLLKSADFKKFYIIINGENFTEILKLSEKLKEDQAKNLRDRLKLLWTNLFKEISIFPDHIVKLFSIFGITIGNFSDMSSCIEIYHNPQLILDNSELYGNRADKLLTYLALSLDREQFSNPSQWLRSNPENPMLFRSYGIYQLWIDRNLETFINMTSTSIIKAFRPKPSKEFIRSALLNAHNNHLLIGKLLSHIIPKNTTIELLIDSISELSLFFYKSIPVIFVYFCSDYKLSLKISWLQLIESSRTIVDYKIILSIISEEELNSISAEEILNSQNVKLFFEYFNQNPDRRKFPKKNRNFLREST